MNFGKDIKGIIFDIDGVLLDSMKIWKDLGVRYLRSKGKEAESGLSEILFSMSMEDGAEYIKSHYLPEMPAEEISEGISKMLEDFYFYEVEIKTGADKLLESLEEAGVKITAATSSPREHVERALSRNGILKFIDRIFTSSEIGSSKHSPEIYDEAAKSMGLKREEVCVFEDSLYALKTAAQAGYHTVGVYDANGEADQTGLEEAAEIYIRDFASIF